MANSSDVRMGMLQTSEFDGRDRIADAQVEKAKNPM